MTKEREAVIREQAAAHDYVAEVGGAMLYECLTEIDRLRKEHADAIAMQDTIRSEAKKLLNEYVLKFAKAREALQLIDELQKASDFMDEDKTLSYEVQLMNLVDDIEKITSQALKETE